VAHLALITAPLQAARATEARRGEDEAAAPLPVAHLALEAFRRATVAAHGASRGGALGLPPSAAAPADDSDIGLHVQLWGWHADFVALTSSRGTGARGSVEATASAQLQAERDALIARATAIKLPFPGAARCCRQLMDRLRAEGWGGAAEAAIVRWMLEALPLQEALAVDVRDSPAGIACGLHGPQQAEVMMARPEGASGVSLPLLQ
jgi:hypothetical protein